MSDKEAAESTNSADLPPEVLQLEQTLTSKGIWFRIAPNDHGQEAKSCWDAAHKRVRLGHSGIPIYCELKSFLGTAEGGSRQVLVHYRGNQEVDLEKVRKVIGGEIQRIIGTGEYGRVNPFIGFDRPDILQVFDSSVRDEEFIPYTMMTNASNRRWGIEFRPKELISKLPNTIVADVVKEETKFQIPKQKIGILTGNSPESGILLWELINNRIRENLGNNFLGDISFPEVIVESIPDMGLSMELDIRFDQVRQTVERGITDLCKSGATIICVACNTTQYFSSDLKKICQNYNATYVRMSDVTASYMMVNGIKAFDFLGIKFVTDFVTWSDFKDLTEGKDLVVNVPRKEVITKISDIAFQVKQKGEGGEGMRSLQALKNLIDSETNTDIVLFALTELSLLFKSHSTFFTRNTKKKYLDTLSILASAVGDLYSKDYMDVMRNSKRLEALSTLELTEGGAAGTDSALIGPSTVPGGALNSRSLDGL